MIGLGLLRGVFLGGVMMWYTMSVWKTVDQYFRDQFQEYLTKEYEGNAAMKQDVLVEKEKLATRKMLLEKLKHFEAGEAEPTEPEHGYHGALDLGMPYVGQGDHVGTEGFAGDGWSRFDEHRGYSAEEVISGQGPGGTAGKEGVTLLYSYPADEDGTAYEEDGGVGECLAGDCGGHDDHVSTKWRNVFDEDGEVCHFDGNPGAEISCSQTDEAWEEIQVSDEQK